MSRNERLVQAVQSVANGMSVRKAAEAYNVSRESLRRRVKGEVAVVCRTGPQLVYLSEGAHIGLLEIIYYRAAHGMCVGKDELACLIRMAALLTSTKPVEDSFPDRSFVQRWIQKHEDTLSMRKARILENVRAQASSSAAVTYYFEHVLDAITHLGLQDKPAQTWNCDETGMSAQGRCQERVICPLGMPANVQRSDDRDNVSMMCCINAAGGFVPPMYLFGGIRRNAAWLLGDPEGTVCTATESSYINGSIFRHWLRWFVEQLPPERPQLLILDGHFAHLDYRAVTWVLTQDVHLFALPAHTSHFLQPLDVKIYQPFKRLYEQELKQWFMEKRQHPLTENMAALTKKPFELAFTQKNIKSAFEKSGIFPLSLDVMLGSVIGNEPSVLKKELCHHAVVIPHAQALQVSQRQQHKLKERDLNVGALNLIKIVTKDFVSPPPKKHRPKATYIDERFSGGVLLSHSDMQKNLQDKENVKEYKKSAKLFKPKEALERDAMNCHGKPQHFTSKRAREYVKAEREREKEELKLMRTNDKYKGPKANKRKLEK